MKLFSDTISKLDETNKTNEKLKALRDFFDQAEDQDKLWALALFTHRRPKKPVNSRQLREWAIEATGLSPWLFEESYQVVGDLSETLALLLPPPTQQREITLTGIINLLAEIREMPETQKKAAILELWDQMDRQERFVFNKLIGGGWRIGVSQNIIVRALSESTGIEPPILSHKIMGNWTPDDISFQELIHEERRSDFISQPYPFYLAYQLEDEPSELGEPSEWQAEWKWDGIRGQIILREGQVFVWSRGEELVTDAFPEFEVLPSFIQTNMVIDGEILPFKNGAVESFGLLQQRLGRKQVSKKLMEKVPVAFFAYDLLEMEQEDLRPSSLEERRKELLLHQEELNSSGLIHISPEIDFDTWKELGELRKKSREMQAEGIMLKRKSSEYKVGRKRGDWWKWKIDPLTIDAVLIYAQKGHGRRAGLFTDYTFGVWDGDQLVPFAKAYSGLTDKEFRQVDRFIKKNTKEKFGPVRTVRPELVFEIAFEGIRESNRHKSGVAVRFPRMSRWRQDKPAAEANSLADIQMLLEKYG